MKIIISDPKDHEKYYEIESPNVYGDVWIRTQDGEGMGMKPGQVFEALDKWFQENM